MEQSSGAAELAARMNRLFAEAGGATYKELAASAQAAGLALSKSSIGNLRTGRCWPRWDTVRSFVLVCKSRAGTPVEAADLAELRALYDYWAESAGPLADVRHRGTDLSATAADATAADATAAGDIHAELAGAIRRFAGSPRAGGGYPFLSLRTSRRSHAMRNRDWLNFRTPRGPSC